MTAEAIPKGQRTREHILKTALILFRRRGFDQSTMRDIAEAAELSLGAAYHYFPSKDALVLSYYDWIQDTHEERVQQSPSVESDLRAQLAHLIHTKLELLKRDRKILAALFRNLGDPSHPLSVFGKETSRVRERSISQFQGLFIETQLAPALQPLLGKVAWLMHMGVLLFFVHDRSRSQTHTRKLADGLIDLLAFAVPLLSLPIAKPFRERMIQLAAETGLDA